MSVLSCPNCGASIPPAAPRCTRCGSPVQRPEPQGGLLPAGALPGLYAPPPAPLLPVVAVKSKQTAAILAYALGWAGMHRFYLGFVTLGIVQLMLSVLFGFCTYGLSFLVALAWGIVEGVLIQNGTISRDADGRPLKS
jgi:TM2 domain-containing membrane protein YozV